MIYLFTNRLQKIYKYNQYCIGKEYYKMVYKNLFILFLRFTLYQLFIHIYSRLFFLDHFNDTKRSINYFLFYSIVILNHNNDIINKKLPNTNILFFLHKNEVKIEEK